MPMQYNYGDFFICKKLKIEKISLKFFYIYNIFALKNVDNIVGTGVPTIYVLDQK